MASVIYNKFKQGVMQASYNLGNFPVFVALLNNSYSPDIDADKYVGQFIGTYEVSGAGYTAGGHALSSPIVTQDDTDDEGVFDANNWVIEASTVTARFAVLYGSSGLGADSDPLICCFDFGSDKITSNGNFTLTWNVEGILNLT